MQQSNILNASKSDNYVSENKIFILGTFASNTCNELIGNLTDMVMELQPCPEYKSGTKLQSPYDIDTSKTPVIDVFINSSGGDGRILDSIIALLSIAKSRGAIIRTTVLSRASSCGSLLAIIGTPGFRIMYSHAYHFVHFGNHNVHATQESEIEAAAQHIKETTNQKNNLYLTHTNLSSKDLKKLQSNESGFLSADQCLAKGLCDWVINEVGAIRKR